MRVGHLIVISLVDYYFRQNISPRAGEQKPGKVKWLRAIKTLRKTRSEKFSKVQPRQLL